MYETSLSCRKNLTIRQEQVGEVLGTVSAIGAVKLSWQSH